MSILVKYEKINIYDLLKNESYKNNKLFQAEIDVTYRCNARCFFCFEGKDHKDTRKILNYEQICSVLDELKETGCFYVGFSGGEPFMRRDFMEILKYAKKIGFVVSIVTNLQLPTKEQIIELANIGINRITVSFHSPFKNTYCDIFNVSSEAYYRALNNIKLLISMNCSVSIAATITTANYKHMHKIKEIFLSMGLSENDINFNMLIQGKTDIVKFRDNPDFQKYVYENKDLKNNTIQKNANFLCSAGRISCTISPYGDVYPCTFFNSSAGNIKDSTINEIWNNSHLFKMIRSISQNNFVKCFDCANKQYCHICMVNNLNETNYYNLPSNTYCEFRKALTYNFSEEQNGNK